MSIELQKVKRSSNLAEWAEMIRCCKSSGLTVKAWCKEHGVNDKTYYYRQKQVCNALPAKLNPPVQFAEVNRTASNALTESIIHIQIGAAKISVDGTTNLDLLRDVLRTVAEIC